MVAPRKYPPELRERAVRLVIDKVEGDDPMPMKTACREVGDALGIARETLRGWAMTALVDSGKRPGSTTDDKARIAELEREVRELRRANGILKTASAFFAAELDRPQPR